MSERIAKRVLLVGWDAADWQMINPLMGEGSMPTLKSMVQQGVHGNLATLQPILSPMLWNSIATGKTADQHGICGFTEPLPDGTGIRPVSSRSRQCKALWNILTQQQMRSHVVGWYASHPAEPIHGTMVSNQFEHATSKLGEPWPLPTHAVHPPEAAESLGSLRVHPGEIDASGVLPFVPNAAQATEAQRKRIGKLRGMLAQTASIHTVATELVAKDDWDFAAVYYEGIDRFGHEFMEFHPPQMDQVDPADFEMFRHAMAGIYRFHDMMLQTLLTLAGSDTLVVLISDHGYFNNQLRPDPQTAGPVAWHRPTGMVAMQGPGILAGERIYGASLLDVAPTVLHFLGLPVGADMRGRAWVDALETPSEVERIISWEAVDGFDGRHDHDAAEDPEAAREAIKQLIDLGYVEAPGEDVQQTIETTVLANQFTLAQSLLSLGRTQEGLDVFEAMPQSSRENPDIMIQRAVCHLKLGDTERAQALAQEIQTKHGDVARAQVITGLLAMQKGDYETSRDLLEKVSEENPTDVDLHTRLGRVYLMNHQPHKAMSTYRKVIELDPDHAAAHDGLAAGLLATGEPDQAVDCGLRAIELMFHFPRAHFHLGQALCRIGEWARAADALQLAVSQAGHYPQAHNELAGVYDALGESRLANEHRLLATESQKPTLNF